MLRRPGMDNTFPLLRQACQTQRKSSIRPGAYCVQYTIVNTLPANRGYLFNGCTCQQKTGHEI